MAQITLTLDLTIETADALRILAEALNKAPTQTSDVSHMHYDDTPAPTQEKTTAKSTVPKPKTVAAKKDDKDEKSSKQEAASADEAAISLTDVRAVALQLSKSGKQTALQEIFKKYGAKKLSDIPQTDYPALMTDLEEAANG